MGSELEKQLVDVMFWTCWTTRLTHASWAPGRVIQNLTLMLNCSSIRVNKRLLLLGTRQLKSTERLRVKR